MADVVGILSKVAGNVLLFLLVFGMSATVETSHMRAQLKNKKAILTGVCCQFILLPLLGFLVVYFMKLDHAVGITLLVVTSSPGGSYSNWWCSLFNADLALSVTMTAISTVLSIAMLPLNLLLYTTLAYEDDVVENLDWMSLFVALLVVIGGIFAGLYCSYYFESKTLNRRANTLGNLAGIALMVFSALVANTGDSDSQIWNRDWTFYVGVCLPCLIGLIVANLIASTLALKKPERVAVAIECCYQNVGIATSLALTMFEGDELNEAMGVPFLYGMAEILFISIYCVGAWRSGWTKAPYNESICKVIFTSYEVETSEPILDDDDQEGDEASDLPSSTKDQSGGGDGDETSTMAATAVTDSTTVSQGPESP